MTPIPELSVATDRLGEAADCVLSGNMERARQLVAQADLPVIADYTAFITGTVNPLVHWQSAVPAAITALSRSEQRMPSASQERGIYVRDGWRCRYCGSRVIERAMRARLHRWMPDVARWGARNADKHSALAAISASLDHVVPHSRGGTNDECNLVTRAMPASSGGANGRWKKSALPIPGSFHPFVIHGTA